MITLMRRFKACIGASDDMGWAHAYSWANTYCTILYTLRPDGYVEVA